MRVSTLATLAMLLYASATLPAASQGRGQPRDQQALMQRMDCTMLARMPNPPMSVAACQARKAAQANLDTAVDTPGGERPGDAAMSCTQVIAEMQSMQFAGVSEGTAHEGMAAGQQLRDAYQGGQARAGAMAARQTAETMAVGAMPNAVQGAVMYRHAAEQKALAAQNSAAIRPARERTAAANTTSMQELAASLQANPRFARLMALTQEKNCQYGDAPPGSAP